MQQTTVKFEKLDAGGVGRVCVELIFFFRLDFTFELFAFQVIRFLASKTHVFMIDGRLRTALDLLIPPWVPWLRSCWFQRLISGVGQHGESAECHCQKKVQSRPPARRRRR